jgi:penicillin-binding protein-related factor A (putative recombinase)
MVPTTLKGSEFETLLMDAAKREEAAGTLTMGRYGVDGMVVAGKNGGASQTLLVPSKPDFEGVLAGGRQFIFEAKVCSGPSFPMQKDKIKPRQVEHMLRRSAFGVPCYLMIHFTERRGQNFFHPAITVAVPVSDASPIWRNFIEAHAEAKRTKEPVASQPALHRDTAQDMGKLVPWRVPKGCRKALPDLLSFLWPEARAIQIPTAQPSLFGDA